MTENAVAVAAIVTSGAFLSVVAWQVLAIARTAVAARTQQTTDDRARSESGEDRPARERPDREKRA